MNEGLETPTGTPRPMRRRGTRWFIVLAGLFLALTAWIWACAPNRDPRLVGEWQSDGRTTRIFHPDGRLEILDLPARTPAWPGGMRWWRTEGDELVMGTQTMESRLRKWFWNQLSSLTGVQHVGLNDSRYKIVELTETRLELLLIREPPRPQRPIEVFDRVSTSSSPQSQSALAQ